MSDLTATNCGCGCNDRCDRGGSNSCIWIILILLFCGNGFGGKNDCDRCNDGCGSGLGNLFGGGDCSCIIIIIVLLFCCGGSGFGFGC